MRVKLILVLCLANCFFLLSQTVKKEVPSAKKNAARYSYVKNKNYKGPEKFTNYPAPLSQDKIEDQDLNNYSYSSGNGGGSLTVEERDQKQFKRNLEKEENELIEENPKEGNNGPNSGTGEGSGPGNKKNKDPEMKMPEPIEFNPPDFDAPDIDAPDIDVDAPSFSATFWRVLFIILIAILLLFIIYLIAKNYRPSNKRMSSSMEQEWNPELIQKTELELRLEKAINEGDYRECVRIYFTFILKEMIRLKRIRWKKEFTNYDYLIQTSGSSEYPLFLESVRIYDLVWYGEYHINNQDYTQLETQLKFTYQQLSSKNA